MRYKHYSKSRVQLKAVPRTTAVKNSKGRRFQVDLETRGILAGDDLIAEFAKCGFNNSTMHAQTALTILEGFILQKLAEGYQIDTNLVSFVPRLSGALSTRDADPETDGLYVQGTVSARPNLRKGLKDKVDAVNVIARKTIRIYNVYDTASKQVNEISAGHVLSVAGHDIVIDTDSPDEGFWLEKRSGRWNGKARFIQRAELLKTSANDAKIIFREPIPVGKYSLVVGTRCGEGRDYSLRRIGHPVTVV